MTTTIALFAGLTAFIAGLMKYGIDVYRYSHRPPTVTISVGDESIDVPMSCTPDQVAALVAILKDKAVTSQTAR